LALGFLEKRDRHLHQCGQPRAVLGTSRYRSDLRLRLVSGQHRKHSLWRSMRLGQLNSRAASVIIRRDSCQIAYHQLQEQGQRVDAAIRCHRKRVPCPLPYRHG
jgi:hypothetical protein